MKSRAKLLSTFVASIVLTFALTACGSSASSNQSASNQSASASASANEITQVGDIVLPTQEEALAKMGLKEAPKSVLCATYNTTIMAHALGLDITGTVTTTRPIPDDLKDTPTIGVVTGRSDFDFEKIFAFGGDAVLADSQYEPKLRPTLDQHGIQSGYLDTSDLAKLQESLATLGCAVGKRDEVVKILTDWNNEIESMQQAIADKPSPTVLIVRKATNMATSASYVGSLFKTLNITCATDKMNLEDTSLTYVPIDAEKILEVDPDIILVPGGAELEGDIKMLEELKTSEAWASLSAVKNGKVFAVTDSYYQPIADMDCIKALHELSEVVYGI